MPLLSGDCSELVFFFFCSSLPVLLGFEDFPLRKSERILSKNLAPLLISHSNYVKFIKNIKHFKAFLSVFFSF